MADLGVNIDHVATLRQARGTAYPDPIAAAVLAELAGARQITVHLREDRRHIQERDVRLLRETVTTRLNLEMAATLEMVKVALTIKPDSVTLVPERREELTTEGGLEVHLQREAIRKVTATLQDADIRVYLFVDPELEQVKAAHMVGANGVEFHTGAYCREFGKKKAEQELARLTEAVRMGDKLKLRLAAGHGLHYENVRPLTVLKSIAEFNIGHSLVARSVLVGMREAVREMVRLLEIK